MYRKIIYTSLFIGYSGTVGGSVHNRYPKHVYVIAITYFKHMVMLNVMYVCDSSGMK
jgi:hypothetical protein